MKKIIISILALGVLAGAVSCLKEENMVVQKFNVPGSETLPDSYYKALREWKNSDHPITYMYAASYTTLEGAQSLNKVYTSIGDRLIALPDSMDVVCLWMGIPSGNPVPDRFSHAMADDNPTAYDYAPVAYDDMQYCRSKKGTKFVAHADASNYGHEFDVDYLGTGIKHYNMNTDKSEECFRAYGLWWVEYILARNIDGIDFDFEGWTSSRLAWTIDEASKYIGPQGYYSDKLLIVDYYGGAPGADIKDNLNFLVKQAYTWQNHDMSPSAPSGYPAEMVVLCEQWNQGTNKSTGGYPWGSAKTLFGYSEPEQMYSLEAFARRCRDNGFLGFGGFYMCGDYYFAKGPFWNVRRCIKLANLPVEEYEALKAREAAL